jgi:hypothetical protein
MSAPYNSLRSKLERAIASYLIAQNAGTTLDTLPEHGRTPKIYPCTVVRCAMSRPEIPYSGNRIITVHVCVRGSAVQESEDNPEESHTAFDERVATVMDTLLQSDTGGSDMECIARGINAAGRALATSDPTNNADMADFTCWGWHDVGEGDGDGTSAEGCSWEEVLMFECAACASNIDG